VTPKSVKSTCVVSDHSLCMSARPSVDAAKLNAVRARLRALRGGATPGRREADKLDDLVVRMAKGKRAQKRKRAKANKQQLAVIAGVKRPPRQLAIEGIAAPAPAVARGKRAREDDNDIPFGLQKRRVTPGGVGFVTRSGKVVTFTKTGKRKRDLKAKIRSGQAKCMVDPITGRAVREGTRKFKKMVKSGPVKVEF